MRIMNTKVNINSNRKYIFYVFAMIEDDLRNGGSEKKSAGHLGRIRDSSWELPDSLIVSTTSTPTHLGCTASGCALYDGDQ